MSKFLILLGVLVGPFAFATDELPHLPIDSTGYDYYRILNQVHVPLRIQQVEPSEHEEIFAMGVRNLEWLAYVNQHSAEKISITSPEKMVGYPVHSPRIYNSETISQDFEKFRAEIPAAMRAVLLEGGQYTKTLPVPKADYENWAWKADRLYQSAARWRLMKPYLWQLAARKVNDVRGYYFLKDIADLDTQLGNYANMDSATKEKYRSALITICVNSGVTDTTCAAEVDRAIQSSQLVALKNRYWTSAVRVWRNYHDIPSTGKFRDVRWTQANEARVPFARPSTNELLDFLKTNIEAEWQWNGWKLIADFDLKSSTAVEVIWEPGITPHVPGLGSNLIYMDSNSLITEWDVQWTIRHEFGHNLGFPDCYHEFYESSKGVIISYQIDITDLMCSRRGKLKQRHFDQMKSAYFGNQIQ